MTSKKNLKLLGMPPLSKHQNVVTTIEICTVVLLTRTFFQFVVFKRSLHFVGRKGGDG